MLSVAAADILSADHQKVILPNMSDRPGSEVMQVWEGILIATVAAYFGSRA